MTAENRHYLVTGFTKERKMSQEEVNRLVGEGLIQLVRRMEYADLQGFIGYEYYWVQTQD